MASDQPPPAKGHAELSGGVTFGLRGCATTLLCAHVFALVAFILTAASLYWQRPALPDSPDSWTPTNAATDAEIAALVIFIYVVGAATLGAIVGIVIGSKRR